MQNEVPAPHKASLSAQSRMGYGLLGLIVFIVLIWGVLAQISGAVIAPGRISVESSVKRIQHKEGGIVQEILVREGDTVKAGQVLLRLDSTLPDANESIIRSQIVQLEARKLRLEAERDGVPAISIANESSLPQEARDIYQAEQKLMTSRLSLRRQMKAQLGEQIRRSEQEITGLKAQVISVDRQHTLILSELEGLKDLHRRGYAPLTRVNQFERQAEALLGQKGELEAGIAQAGSQISALRTQILQVDSEALAEVMAELKDTDKRLAQLRDQQVTAEDAVRRIEITAPVNGKVQGLSVHTRGGVISPAEVLMTIVPDGDALIIEAHVDPRYGDQVKQGSRAHVRFTAFSTQSTPEALGAIDNLSADVQTDERTGENYYVARMTLVASKLPGSIRDKLMAGMPVEVQIETSRRSAVSYFFKPLTDQFNRAFRED